jgi:hypothetical protein
VLSGEVIIFQNEVQEIFRRLINLSEVPLEEDEAKQLLASVDTFLLEKSEFQALSCKYCLAIIEEYNRCLMEHQIPQSPSQQGMLTQYILK